MGLFQEHWGLLWLKENINRMGTGMPNFVKMPQGTEALGTVSDRTCLPFPGSIRGRPVLRIHIHLGKVTGGTSER